jgi:PKD repeat protein
MRFRIAAIAAATLVLGFVAPPAWAAAPDVPVLVAPASGSTASGTSVPLAVTASDPDGGTLGVRFEGRKLGATSPAAPFTVVAVPDTQNYTYSGRTAILNQHLQWVADSRTQLNTAMVTELGDLVSTYTSDAQWQIISNAFKILDDAGVPNTVVGGNHDFDPATGAFPLYDTYFPPSRYTGASWTPSTARYGGYLGQNLFGPDPVDRRNMDNFALFSAGGIDWVMLNLEWEAPSYAMEWAAKVLDAYPDRLAIISTHAFVAENGNRSTITERTGATPPDTIWNNLVKTHCTVRLVLNGHYHNSTGEARRSDLNNCGNTVHQVLSNYQDRVNGGDGWLRYYTFDPVADTMSAKTYSTRLNQFETDDNSQFTVPFVLPDAPATYTPIGTVAIPSGGTATVTWSGLDPAATYEWRAVADDGTATATSPAWTLSTPGATPTELARDGFSRVGSRWGTAEVGGAWTDSGSAYFATDGTYGQVTVSRAGSGPSASLVSVSARDVSLTTDVALAAVPTGGAFTHTVQARVNGTTSYALSTRLETTGALRLYLSRFVAGVETQLRTTTLSTFGYTAGERLKVRLDVQGSGTTALEGRAWRASAPEPTAAMVAASDTTAALQAAGGVGLRFYTGGGTTSLPTRASVDGFRALPTGGPPPVNQPPVAAFTATPSAWQVAVDASASSDDGTITGYAWDFGDGTTGTGRTTSHRYTADGTYPVTLTVTDDQGATASLAKQVTVENAAPAPSFTASANGLTVAADASASSDDGSITGYAWDWGDSSTGSGRTSSHTYAAAGTYTVVLTITDDAGKTATASRTVTVTAPPTSTVLAGDTFARTLPSSWGTADTGGAWTITSTTMFSVNGSQGLVTIPAAGKGPVAYLNSVSARDVSVVTDFALDKTPAGGAYSHSVLARMNGTGNAYVLTARVNPNGSLQVFLARLVSGAETQLKSVTLSTFGYTAGDRLKLRLDVSGSGTTSLAGRVWRASASEPAADQVSTTDTTTSLQGPGALGVKAYTSSALSSLPVQVSVAGFRATPVGTP